jgi:hypothetical protein
MRCKTMLHPASSRRVAHDDGSRLATAVVEVAGLCPPSPAWPAVMGAQRARSILDLKSGRWMDPALALTDSAHVLIARRRPDVWAAGHRIRACASGKSAPRRQQPGRDMASRGPARVICDGLDGV